MSLTGAAVFFLSCSFFALFFVSSTLYFLEGASDELALATFFDFYKKR
jgi:hypothetical protein